jgi:hypothetical protein
MSLPKTFQFSATSLQDYVDCHRRFQLRYLLQVAWPAPEAEPIDERERRGQLARDFHQLVHQHLLGLPAELLSASVHDPDLERWWQAYLTDAPQFGTGSVVAEVGLSTVLAGHRLMAQYDAIFFQARVSSGDAEVKERELTSRPSLLIVDWKTYRRRPSRVWLARRLQTRVYPLVLVQAGSPLFYGSPSVGEAKVVTPENIEMRYWLAEYPQDPESFIYDTDAYQGDLEYLTALIAEITERIQPGESGVPLMSMSSSDDIWPLTSDLDQCRYCNYRSLCRRGDVAGSLANYADDYDEDPSIAGSELDFDLDWGQVQEIAY